MIVSESTEHQDSARVVDQTNEFQKRTARREQKPAIVILRNIASFFVTSHIARLTATVLKSLEERDTDIELSRSYKTRPVL